jgi:hypothetical protein
VYKSIDVFQTYCTLRHTMPYHRHRYGRLFQHPHSSPVVSHANKSRASRPDSRLFRNTVVGVKAVGELLAVLVRGVVGKHLLAGGALEGLEAGFALDGLGRGVLVTSVSIAPGVLRRNSRTAFSWLLASLGPLSPLRSRFCCALSEC